jgi:hypothetical protein
LDRCALVGTLRNTAYTTLIAPDPDEEAAAAKLWAVYVSEAEKYDRSLVESWKRDMEGMLIFASVLYSINIDI